jgi:hypothetical protein
MPDFSSLDFFTLVGALAGGAIFVAIVYFFVYLSWRLSEPAAQEPPVFHHKFPGRDAALGLIFAALALPTGYALSNTTIRFFRPVSEQETDEQTLRFTEDERYRKWIFTTPDKQPFRELLRASWTLREEAAFSRPSMMNLYHLAGRARLFGTMMINGVAACIAMLWLIPPQDNKLWWNVRRWVFGIAVLLWIVVYYLVPNLLGPPFARLAIVIAIPAPLIVLMWWFSDPQFRFRDHFLIGAFACLLAAGAFGREAVQQYKSYYRILDVRLLFERNDSGRIISEQEKVQKKAE